MKRTFAVLAIVTLMLASFSGCRGVGSWCGLGGFGEPAYQECVPACEPDCGDIYSPGAPMGSTVPPGLETIPPTPMPST
jgi:hypothetical protein